MKYDQYFAEATKMGRPRILFTIGIPGSGKSFATKSATAHNWVRINSDELRIQHLRDLNSRGKTLELNGQQVVPDENNPEHVFHQTLRNWVNKKVFDLLNEYTDQKKNIVFDITNVSLQRVLYMQVARRKGYYVEGFVFEPNDDIFVHLENVEKRVSEGGLDLSAKSEKQRQSRLAVIRSVLNAYKCFSPSMKQDRYYFKHDDAVDVDFQWAKMKSTPNDYQIFLRGLAPEERQTVQTLAGLDIFNELHTMPVRRYQN